MKFHLLGEEASVGIEIIGQAFPHSENAIDCNMLNAIIKIRLPGYKVNFPTSLSTIDLERFFISIKAMYEEMRGTAILDHRDAMIEIKGTINKLGQIEWSGETCYPAGTGATLTFEFTSDQSYLDKLIKDLAKIMKPYPVLDE